MLWMKLLYHLLTILNIIALSFNREKLNVVTICTSGNCHWNEHTIISSLHIYCVTRSMCCCHGNEAQVHCCSVLLVIDPKELLLSRSTSSVPGRVLSAGVEWLAFLLCVMEVLASILGQHAASAGFVVFLSCSSQHFSNIHCWQCVKWACRMIVDDEAEGMCKEAVVEYFNAFS
jgi:hypothetical protein